MLFFNKELSKVMTQTKFFLQNGSEENKYVIQNK